MDINNIYNDDILYVNGPEIPKCENNKSSNDPEKLNENLHKLELDYKNNLHFIKLPP